MGDKNKWPWKTGAIASLHCLIGCGIGETLGLIISTHLGWGVWSSLVLAVSLAFLFGFILTAYALRSYGMIKSIKMAIAADVASITVMEIVDNTVFFSIMHDSHMDLSDPLWFIVLASSLFVAYLFVLPLNTWMIHTGRGHHHHHGGHGDDHGHSHDHSSHDHHDH